MGNGAPLGDTKNLRSSLKTRALLAVDLCALLLWRIFERSLRLLVLLLGSSGAALMKAAPLRELAAKPPIIRIANLLNAPLKLAAASSRGIGALLDASPIARRLLLAACLLLLLRGALFSEEIMEKPPGKGWSEAGVAVASYYDKGFLGRSTANGEIFNTWSRTAAHRTLPFGTWLRLRNLENGRETFVRVNDRGPFIEGRDVDLSRAAAKDLGMLSSGLARVEMSVHPPRGLFGKLD
jgi:hypothetical protein